VLEYVKRDVHEFDLFVIETNGFVIAQEPDVAKRLAEYAPFNREMPGHVRMSIRGGFPETFEEKTGCRGEFFEMPFKAAEYLWDADVSFHVAVVVDPRFTSAKEKVIIYDRLKEIDPTIARGVEEEFLDPYPHALVRLRAVGREDVVGKEISGREQRVLSKIPKSDE
jgi:uncharacterized Fe-S cluster-containing radical SAM superfamily protein